MFALNAITDISTYTGGPVACNAYLLRGVEGWVAVDAPLGFADWAAARLPKGETIAHLLLTHQHFDHVQDAAKLRRTTGCRIHAFAPCSEKLCLSQAARAWGIDPPEPFEVDDAFGTALTEANWGGFAWKLWHIPGHSPDGMAYQLEEARALFVGDILFAGSIGRTDFPGGSHATLVRGIREKLVPLDPESLVLSGHGPRTTLQEELINNPYLP